MTELVSAGSMEKELGWQLSRGSSSDNQFNDAHALFPSAAAKHPMPLPWFRESEVMGDGDGECGCASSNNKIC